MLGNSFFNIEDIMQAQAFEYITIILSIALILILLILARSRSIIYSIILLSGISTLSCLLYLLLDAPDVALTEAAVGAALSTVILINFAIRLKASNISPNSKNKILLGICGSIVSIVLLLKIGSELPPIGDSSSPIHNSAAKHYLERTNNEIGIPAFVAAILASYRGFDTFGETTVILIAAIIVTLIMNIKDAK